MIGGLRLVCIVDDGDCEYTKHDNLVVPAEMDLAKERADYDAWFQDMMARSIRADHPAAPWAMDFIAWLESRGARRPTSEEVEVFEVD